MKKGVNMDGGSPCMLRAHITIIIVMLEDGKKNA